MAETYKCPLCTETIKVDAIHQMKHIPSCYYALCKSKNIKPFCMCDTCKGEAHHQSIGFRVDIISNEDNTFNMKVGTLPRNVNAQEGKQEKPVVLPNGINREIQVPDVKLPPRIGASAIESNLNKRKKPETIDDSGIDIQFIILNIDR